MKHRKSLEEVFPSKKGGLIHHIIPLCSDYSLYFWHKMCQSVSQVLAGKLHHLLVLVCMFIIQAWERCQSKLSEAFTPTWMTELRLISHWYHYDQCMIESRYLTKQSIMRVSEQAERLHIYTQAHRAVLAHPFLHRLQGHPVISAFLSSVSCLSSIFFLSSLQLCSLTHTSSFCLDSFSSDSLESVTLFLVKV